MQKHEGLLIKKGNGLIAAKYRLNRNEQIVLHHVISQIRIDDQDFQKYQIKIAEVAKLHNLESSNLYKTLKKACEVLLTKVVTVGDENIGTKCSWFSSVKYSSRSGTLYVDFHPSLKSHLLQLKEHFTTYEYQYIQKFKCNYTIRFYEFLKAKQYLGKGDKFYLELTIKELRDVLCLKDTEYKATKDLRVNVIEKSLYEINEYTDLDIIDVDYLKQGRAIHSICINAKPTPKKETAKLIPKKETAKLINSDVKLNNHKNDLEISAKKITSFLAKNKITDRFLMSGESQMDAMKRIQKEINSQEMLQHYTYKIEELGYSLD